MEKIAAPGTLDPQHAIAQFVKALTDPARPFAFVRGHNGGPAGPRRGVAILMATGFRGEMPLRFCGS
jgi:hypothetical protein